MYYSDCCYNVTCIYIQHITLTTSCQTIPSLFTFCTIASKIDLLEDMYMLTTIVLYLMGSKYNFNGHVKKKNNKILIFWSITRFPSFPSDTILIGKRPVKTILFGFGIFVCKIINLGGGLIIESLLRTLVSCLSPWLFNHDFFFIYNA